MPCLAIALRPIKLAAWRRRCLGPILFGRRVLTPQVWFDESEAAAEVFAYAQPIGEGDGPYTLTDDYQQKAIDVAHAQAAVAGARLAALLNAALAGP